MRTLLAAAVLALPSALRAAPPARPPAPAPIAGPAQAAPATAPPEKVHRVEKLSDHAYAILTWETLFDAATGRGPGRVSR